jgi:hypothetical protein
MFGPTARRAGLLSAGVAAIVVGLLAARFGWDNFIRGDGRSFVNIAGNLSGDGLGSGDGAYRYGRILYPLAGLLLAGGNRAWLQWSLPVVNCLALGAAVMCSVELAVRRGSSMRRGLIMLAVPAMWMCLLVAWSEALLVALLLGFVVCHEDRRDLAAAACLALAILTKETAALLLVPFVVEAMRRRDRRALAVRTAAAVPAFLWWSWTRVQLGAWPFLADSPSRARAVGPPFAGIVELVHDNGVNAIHVAEIIMIVAVVGSAVWIWVQQPASVVAGSAAISGAFLLCLGPNVLSYSADTLRLLSPTVALILATRIIGDRPEPSVPDEVKVATPAGAA